MKIQYSVLLQNSIYNARFSTSVSSYNNHKPFYKICLNIRSTYPSYLSSILSHKMIYKISYLYLSLITICHVSLQKILQLNTKYNNQNLVGWGVGKQNCRCRWTICWCRVCWCHRIARFLSMTIPSITFNYH